MTTAKRSRMLPILIVAAALAAVLAVVAAVRRAESLPGGPQDVVWDHTQCAECRMSVSERAWAAQAQLTDGRVLDFDDCGCLFRFTAREKTPVHAVYYRHLKEDRWLAEAEAAFITAGPSPMGYDLGAVAAGTPGSEPAARVRAQHEAAVRAADGGTAHAH
ncbi:hypothetical protein FJ250_11760 [bacterium]|nr:hypothetical protein [bacterium]